MSDERLALNRENYALRSALDGARHEAGQHAEEVTRLRSCLAEVEQELRIARFDAETARGECDMAIAAATMQLRERAERAEAALKEIGLSLDLSDDYTFDHAAPGALVSCTRDIESWKRIRAALASVPSSLDAPKEQNDG